MTIYRSIPYWTDVDKRWQTLRKLKVLDLYWENGADWNSLFSYIENGTKELLCEVKMEKIIGGNPDPR